MRAKNLLIPVTMVLAGGCASGGGGSGGSGPASDANRPPPAPAEPSPCGTINGRPVQCVPNQRTRIDEAMRQSEEEIRKLPVSFFEAYYGYTPYWAQPTSSLSSPSKQEPATSHVRMDLSYEPNVLGTITRTELLSDEYSRRIGLPIAGDIAPAPGDPKAVNPFTQRPGNAGVDSAGLGFEYHSFGVWNEHVGFRGGIMAWSHGRTTPASAVPTSGNARFTGQVVGLYVSPAGTGSSARADLNVDANFSTRTLGFTSANTTVQGVANPHLNLSGTLSYAQGQNNFAGTLGNASGTLAGTSKGQFYGPKAEELGGAFRVGAGRGPETFAGAYGAKRQ